MQLLDDHLWSLYKDGKISLEEMVDKARNPSDLLEKAEGKKRSADQDLQDEMDDIGPVIGGDVG